MDPIKKKRKATSYQYQKWDRLSLEAIRRAMTKTMPLRWLSCKTTWLYKLDDLSSKSRTHIKSWVQWYTTVIPTLLVARWEAELNGLRVHRLASQSGYTHQQKQEALSQYKGTDSQKLPSALDKHISEKLRVTNICWCRIKERCQSTSPWK